MRPIFPERNVLCHLGGSGRKRFCPPSHDAGEFAADEVAEETAASLVTSLVDAWGEQIAEMARDQAEAAMADVADRIAVNQAVRARVQKFYHEMEHKEAERSSDARMPAGEGESEEEEEEEEGEEEEEAADLSLKSNNPTLKGGEKKL